jgi:hypothetical protein
VISDQFNIPSGPVLGVHLIIAVQREIDGLESDLAKTRAEIRKHLKELGL